jgi:membrane protein implicated in regulation of membrane protease activity
MSSLTWFIVGIVFLCSELLVPTGFFLFLLGIAASLVGVVTLSGLVPWWQAQFAIFAVLAVLFPFAFAAKLKRMFLGSSHPGSNDTTGKIVVLSESVAPGAIGSGELWGSTWRVKNVDSIEFATGTEVIVVHAEGVTLQIRRKQ